MTVLATPSLPDRLKDATADVHKYAETRPLQKDLVKGTIGREALVAYFGQLQHLHAALEDRLDALADDPAFTTIAATFGRHAPRLRADLAAAGQEPDAVTPDPALARFVEDRTTREDLLGALYVLEGSMNGNRYIAMALMGRRAELSFSYFDPYGDEQRARWQACRQAIEGLDRDEAAEAQVLAAADATFRLVADLADASTIPAA